MFYPEFSKPFAEIIDSLSGKIVVLGHARPDGDCIGSQIALCRMLNASGKDAVAINNDPAPRTLKPFLGDTAFHLAADHKVENATVLVCDCADALRVGQSVLDQYPLAHLLIDHHISNTGYAKHDFIDPKSAATCEILAGIFIDNNMPMDKVTAEALYVGIITDTGMFRFPSTSKRLFEIAGCLLDAGVNPGEVSNKVYENESLAKMKLLQAFLASLKIENGGNVCIGTLPNGIYEKCSADSDDSEGLVDYARGIEGVEIGVLLEERGASTKGSLRASIPEYRVDLIAATFGGGGHACAAGFNVDTSIESFYSELIEVIQKHIQSLELPSGK